MPLWYVLFIVACNALIHSVLQNGPFHAPKRPILPSKMAHFIVRNGPFRKSVVASPFSCAASYWSLVNLSAADE